jgi:hypothetical protein
MTRHAARHRAERRTLHRRQEREAERAESIFAELGEDRCGCCASGVLGYIPLPERCASCTHTPAEHGL